MRQAIFHFRALEIVRSFPRETRLGIGKAIRDLQKGYSIGMPLSRPMPAVAIGAFELRIKDNKGAYRVFYYLKSKKGVLVFHAFVKKTQKTPQAEIVLARKRLKELLNEKES